MITLLEHFNFIIKYSFSAKACQFCPVLYMLQQVTICNKTHFSLSPSHFDTRSEDEIEKKVELLASVATALAR